ncbi:hypothetical protein PVK06_002081 [Gossypium arboreum]|uniref:Uncharacterized protein n=1 Tax=Gossypium arboreum TaxID=29729 RepID=A0ABR0R2R9_GOSAR|nr:hypothetical protein PVK06_002081 [Gossypium arboreum]
MTKAHEQQACYWSYVKDRYLALKWSLQKNITKPMPELLDFPKVLLPFSKVEEEPVEIHSNMVKFVNMRAIPDTVKATEEELEKTKSLNIKSDEDEQNGPIIAAKATKKGKETIPPTSPQAMTAQDCEINRVINEITKTDKEGEDVPLYSMKRKLHY